MVVVIDVREPKEAEEWFKHQNLDLLLKRDVLEVGDYLIKTPNGEVACERKTITDYVASLEDGRLTNQLYLLSSNYELSYLFVIGVPSIDLYGNPHLKFNPHAFFSSLVGSSLKVSPDGKRGRVITIMLENNYQFALCVYYLHKKLEKGDFDRIPRPIGKKSDNLACLIMLYSCLPGVGYETAKRLAKKFPSLPSLLSASVQDLAKVKGIGYEKAKRIYEFLHNSILSQI